ncbi:hypothetical protein ABVF61_19160 [Roseibium sp. HPY-6]|uniref:hypothetical protein n=1 Tax=Roseibium sp. HPY-6 TaxID=3229852 RepID=UPI00338D6801
MEILSDLRCNIAATTLFDGETDKPNGTILSVPHNLSTEDAMVAKEMVLAVYKAAIEPLADFNTSGEIGTTQEFSFRNTPSGSYRFRSTDVIKPDSLVSMLELEIDNLRQSQQALELLSERANKFYMQHSPGEVSQLNNIEIKPVIEHVCKPPMS